VRHGSSLVALLVAAAVIPGPIVEAPPRRAAGEDWITLGTRVQGEFDSYTALGIRIGLDALEQLQTARGEVDITLFDGPLTRCPCAADGLMLATGATPGRETFRVDAAWAGEDDFALIVVRDRKSGRTMRCTVPLNVRELLDRWNRLAPAFLAEARVLSISKIASVDRDETVEPSALRSWLFETSCSGKTNGEHAHQAVCGD
jgi:formylmethanofuran dehydrogenase subunit E